MAKRYRIWPDRILISEDGDKWWQIVRDGEIYMLLADSRKEAQRLCNILNREEDSQHE